jgi:simple sugar transport system permease protein
MKSSRIKTSTRLFGNVAQFREVIVYGVLFCISGILIVTFSLISAQFATLGNFLNLFRQIAPNLIAGVGMTYVICSGGIDLSIGSLLAVVGVLTALVTQATKNLFVIIAIAILTGILTGAFSGYFTAFHNFPAFIVTLGTMSILRGIALVLTKGFSIPIDPSHPVIVLGRGWFLGLPVPVWIAFIVILLSGAFFNLTPYGTYVAGIGSNEEATRRAGINVKLLRFYLYCFNGAITALAGIILAARVAAGSSYVGQGFELSVITAVILGGTPLVGGEARLLGTLLGTFVLSLVGNGLIMAQISPYFTQIAEGFILLLAIVANRDIRLFIQRQLKL